MTPVHTHTFSLLANISYIPHNPAAHLLLQSGCVLGYWVSHLCETPERNSSVGWMWKLVADETNWGRRKKSTTFKCTSGTRYDFFFACLKGGAQNVASGVYRHLLCVCRTALKRVYFITVLKYTREVLLLWVLHYMLLLDFFQSNSLQVIYKYCSYYCTKFI